MSIDSHLIAKFTHENLIEIEEGKLLLPNREFKISILLWLISINIVRNRLSFDI